MRRTLALAAIFAVGIGAAMTVTRTASASLSCSTNTAAEVAAATVTNLGLGWSSPANPDPLWNVDLPALNMGLSVYAPDEAHARINAKASLDTQVAALGCATTTTASTTTTQAATTTSAPVTTTVVTTTTTPAANVIVFAPLPPAAPITTEAASVAPVQPPINVNVTVNFPSRATTLDTSDAACTLRAKRVPCASLAGHTVRIVGTWRGKTITARTIVSP